MSVRNNFYVDEQFSRKCADCIGGSIEYNPFNVSEEAIQPDPQRIREIEENPLNDDKDIRDEYMKV